MAWQDRWSPEEMHEKVRKLLFEDGLSTRVAAERLGADVTKNMVIRIRQTLTRKGIHTVSFPDSIWPSVAKVPGEKVSDPPEVPVHLTAVKESQCRAPLWPDFTHSAQRAPTSDHMLCGRRCRDGSLYCEEHHVRFYPPELQKRKAKAKREEVKDNSRHFG